MFKWLKRLFKKDEVNEEIKEDLQIERVSLEKIDISEPLLKSDETLEAPETRYTDDYAEFVDKQFESSEDTPIDRSMPTRGMADNASEEEILEAPETRYTEEYAEFVDTQLPEEELINEEEVVEDNISREIEDVTYDDGEYFVDDYDEEDGSFEDDIYEGETAIYETLLEPLDDEDINEDA